MVLKSLTGTKPSRTGRRPGPMTHLPAERPNDAPQQSPLAAALAGTFRSDRDRVVFDSPSALSGGLSAALGFIGARDRLGEDHWVVYVSGQTSPESIVGQLERWDALRHQRFLLIIASHSAHILNRPHAAVQYAMRRGVRVVDLTACRRPSELKAKLLKTRATPSPGVILVHPETLKASAPDDPLDRRGDCQTSHRNTDTTRLLIDALVAAALSDPRITPVLVSPEPSWRRLIDRLPTSLLRVAPHEVSEAIPWCLALADGGCHPVLIMNRRQFEQQRCRLADELRRDPQVMTIIVDDRSGPVSRVAELVGDGRNPAIAGGIVSGLPWATPHSPRDAVSRLRTSLSERSPLALELRLPANGTTVSNDSSPGSTRGRRRGDEIDSCASDRAAVAGKQLSPDVLRWVNEYEDFGHRTRYLWQWCLHGLELTTLSSVPEAYRQHLCDTKLLAVLFGVLLDDVADRDKDGAFLQRLVAAVADGGERDFDDLPPERRRYADFTCRLWDEYLDRLRGYPRFREFAEVLDYDSRRVVNTMRYAVLVNADVRLMNRVEHDLYTPHNMQMMTFAMVDLMASPGFEISELGRLREAIWHAQCMGRIGNLVSTWERELDERDFSSGVFTRLLDLGCVNIAGLPEADRETIHTAVRSGGIESLFLAEWDQHRRELQAMVREVGSVDLTEIITALERLIRMEFFSRGLK